MDTGLTAFLKRQEAVAISSFDELPEGYRRYYEEAAICVKRRAIMRICEAVDLPCDPAILTSHMHFHTTHRIQKLMEKVSIVKLEDPLVADDIIEEAAEYTKRVLISTSDALNGYDV